MIISASRRTDIPAFYSEWFINRIKEGYFLVRNPMNYHQVGRVELNPKIVDCIVFWTKNPRNIIGKLNYLKEYCYYFQFTLTPYGRDIESGIPNKREIIETFIQLSKTIGRKRVIWRYDPIILTEKITKEYHYKWFEYLTQKLHPYTEKCVVSFVDMYRKTEKNIAIKSFTNKDMEEIATNIMAISQKYGLVIETCSEEIDLDGIGIKHGKCIDDELISEILGVKINVSKDKNQREVCGCASSIDVGAYNTCSHGCLYCYANYSINSVRNNIKKHNPKSPLIIGELEESDTVYVREMVSYKEEQLSLFNI